MSEQGGKALQKLLQAQFGNVALQIRHSATLCGNERKTAKKCARASLQLFQAQSNTGAVTENNTASFQYCMHLEKALLVGWLGGRPDRHSSGLRSQVLRYLLSVTSIDTYQLRATHVFPLSATSSLPSPAS